MSTESKRDPRVELCRVLAGEISVRLNGVEVTTLPAKDKIEMEDITRVMNSIIELIEDEYESEPPPVPTW